MGLIKTVEGRFIYYSLECVQRVAVCITKDDLCILGDCSHTKGDVREGELLKAKL